MWILFYLALNSPIGAMANFRSHEDCERFRNELSQKLPIKHSGCLYFDPWLPGTPQAGIAPSHTHEELHGHEGGK